MNVGGSAVVLLEVTLSDEIFGSFFISDGENIKPFKAFADATIKLQIKTPFILSNSKHYDFERRVVPDQYVLNITGGLGSTMFEI